MKSKLHLTFDKRTIIAYPELLSKKDLPQGARKAAPGPPISSSNLQYQEIESYSAAIWEWASKFPGLERRLNDHAENLRSDAPQTILQRLGGGPGADLPETDGGRGDLIKNATDAARDLLNSPSTSSDTDEQVNGNECNGRGSIDG